MGPGYPGPKLFHGTRNPGPTFRADKKKNQDAGRKAQDILDSKTGRKAQNKGARFLNR